jgi:hypothetical protein
VGREETSPVAGEMATMAEVHHGLHAS